MTQPTNQPDLWHEADGSICARFGDGRIAKNLVPLSLFPLSEDHKNIILLEGGEEVFFIEDTTQLEKGLANAIRVALLRNRFILKLLKIKKISGLRTPSEWEVLTDRGHASMVFSSEEAIRRLPDDGALIQDSQGIRYLVSGIGKMDAFSRKVIEYYI